MVFENRFIQAIPVSGWRRRRRSNIQIVYVKKEVGHFLSAGFYQCRALNVQVTKVQQPITLSDCSFFSPPKRRLLLKNNIQNPSLVVRHLHFNSCQVDGIDVSRLNILFFFERKSAVL